MIERSKISKFRYEWVLIPFLEYFFFFLLKNKFFIQSYYWFMTMESTGQIPSIHQKRFYFINDCKTIKLTHLYCSLSTRLTVIGGAS